MLFRLASSVRPVPQNRSDDDADDSPVFCLCVDVDRFVLGVVAFRFQPDPPLSGYREPLQRDFVADCRKVALGRETGDRTLDRERVTARDVSRWLGADTGDAQGLDRLRRRLDAPAIPSAVRAKGRQVFDRPVSDRLGVDRPGLHHPRCCGALPSFRGFPSVVSGSFPVPAGRLVDPGRRIPPATKAATTD